MGSIESRDFKSIAKVLIGLILLLIYFAFVIILKLFSFWRSLSPNKGLQSELDATNKEGECVRQRLRFQDAQLEKVKEKQDLSAEEEQIKYGEKILRVVNRFSKVNNKQICAFQFLWTNSIKTP